MQVEEEDEADDDDEDKRAYYQNTSAANRQFLQVSQHWPLATIKSLVETYPSAI